MELAPHDASDGYGNQMPEDIPKREAGRHDSPYNVIAQAIAAVQSSALPADSLKDSLEKRLYVAPELFLKETHLNYRGETAILFLYREEDWLGHPRDSVATAPLDYEKAWYGDDKPSARLPAEELEYDQVIASLPDPDARSEMLTMPEMEKAFMECQYAALVGAWSDVSPERKRQLSWSILMDPVMFSLIQSLHTITRDVNYGFPF